MKDKVIKETELFVKNINNKTHKELLKDLKKDNENYNRLLLKTFLMIENKN